MTSYIFIVREGARPEGHDGYKSCISLYDSLDKWRFNP